MSDDAQLILAFGGASFLVLAGLAAVAWVTSKTTTRPAPATKETWTYPAPPPLTSSPPTVPPPKPDDAARSVRPPASFA